MAEEAPTLGDLDNEPAPQVVESVAETLDAVMNGADDEPAIDTGDAEAGGADGEDGRPRDEHGRFVSTKAEDGQDEVPKDTNQPLEPPADWPAEQHEIFRGLDPKAQQFVLDSVKNATDKAGEATRQVERYKAFDAVIAEHKGVWAAKGLDETAAIRSLATLSAYADRNPKEFIKWFADGKNIDLAELAGRPPETDDDDDLTDPEVRALKADLKAAREEIAQIKGAVESRSQAESERVSRQEQEHVAAEVEKFRTAKTDEGRLAHPYFDQVADFMVSLIEAEARRGRNLTLAEAYETACRADRDVSGKIESARKAKEARDEAAKRREKSTAAERAGSSITGKPAATEAHTSDSIADILRAEAQSRGLIPNAI